MLSIPLLSWSCMRALCCTGWMDDVVYPASTTEGIIVFSSETSPPRFLGDMVLTFSWPIISLCGRLSSGVPCLNVWDSTVPCGLLFPVWVLCTSVNFVLFWFPKLIVVHVNDVLWNTFLLCVFSVMVLVVLVHSSASMLSWSDWKLREWSISSSPSSLLAYRGRGLCLMW